MPLPLDLVIDPGGVEFRTQPNQLGRIGGVRVARADLSALAGHLARRFELDTTDEDRILAAAIAVMADRGEIRAQYVGNHHHAAGYCRRAGIGYELTLFDGRRWWRTARCVPLFQATEPNGLLRVLSVTVDLPGGEPEPDDVDEDADDLAVGVLEEFCDPAADDPDDGGYSHGVRISHRDFEALTAALEQRFDLPTAGEIADRAQAICAALVAQGELGSHLPPGGNTQRLTAWCRQTGGIARQIGVARAHQILRSEQVTLTLRFDTDVWQPKVRFIERHGSQDLYTRGTSYEVTAALDAVPQLAQRLETRLGLRPAPGRFDDRLIVCFDELAARGHFTAELPYQGNRAVAADWIGFCGVQTRLHGFARTEHLVHAYRRNSDSSYDLTLVMDRTAPDGQGIRFSEDYEYYPKPGDAGREYTYSITTPYNSLAALVASLEHQPESGDLEERLARCFHRLVAAGELAADLEIEAATRRVATRFRAAGVPTDERFSQWVNTD